MSSGIANGAVSTIPPNDPFSATAFVNAATTTNIYTVPPGKTLYITSLTMIPGASTNARVLIDAAIAFRADGIASPLQISDNPLLTLNAGEVLAFSTLGGGVYCNFNVSGYQL